MPQLTYQYQHEHEKDYFMPNADPDRSYPNNIIHHDSYIFKYKKVYVLFSKIKCTEVNMIG